MVQGLPDRIQDLPGPDASPVEVWEAFAELEERRIEGDGYDPAEHRRLALRLGIEQAPADPGWTSALWQAMAGAAHRGGADDGD